MSDEKPPGLAGMKVWTAKSRDIPVIGLIKRLLGKKTESPPDSVAVSMSEVAVPVLPTLMPSETDACAIQPENTPIPTTADGASVPAPVLDDLHETKAVPDDLCETQVVPDDVQSRQPVEISADAQIADRPLRKRNSKKAIKRGPTKAELRAERKRKKIEKFITTLGECIRKHTKTLYYKRRMVLIPDDYGHVNRETWDAEVDYFIEHVLPKQIALRKVLTRLQLRKQIDKIVRTYEPDEEDSMPDLGDPLRFEDSIRKIFEDCGWKARLTLATGDQGVDVVASKNRLSVAVQCKLYSGPVGNSAVQEVAAGKVHYRCDLAIVVTTTTFTPSARNLAVSTGVALLHYSKLNSYIKELENRDRRASAR